MEAGGSTEGHRLSDEARRILDSLPQDGTPRGNASLRAQLGLPEESYRRGLGELRAVGLLKMGPGRGGTVRRLTPGGSQLTATKLSEAQTPWAETLNIHLTAARPPIGLARSSLEDWGLGGRSPRRIGALMARLADTLRTNFNAAGSNPAWAEDQLKGPMQTFLGDAGTVLGHRVVARTEATSSDVAGRPDIGVTVDELLTGYVELKAPGKGADPTRWSDRDRDQWMRFQSLPNLVYTDGREWALYRNGEREGPLVRLDGPPTLQGHRAISRPDEIAIEGMLRNFLDWSPVVPRTPDGLAKLLAPLCRLLREQVLEGLKVEGSTVAQLAGEWRQYLFGDADDPTFADAYAQTVTYALLLARLEGEGDLRFAAERLDSQHGLLAQVLRLLAQPDARREIEVPVALIERVVAAVDPALLASAGSDPWLYFYEDFLAAYDQHLRRERGVYYTPAPVVACQVSLVADLLDRCFGKPLAYADDDVVLLDPACGTGTYPLAAIRLGLDRAEARYGRGVLPGRATTAAANTHAFEILVGPYAVAHLRLAQAILAASGQLPVGGVGVYLTDTLETPQAGPATQTHTDVFHRRLAIEAERARAVKARTRVLVCLGNPPYDRQVIDPDDPTTRRKGGWVRFGQESSERPLLEDFLEPARKAGAGVHLKNLYNDYVYFWRWALWKVFDSTHGKGIVSFITAASYLTGPAFVGMRDVMRRTFDDLWIIDLGGEGRGARRTENVFDIQTPVAIAIGVRYGPPKPGKPATVRYTSMEGTRAEKFAQLNRAHALDSLVFETCPTGWADPFVPKSDGDYATWPPLTDLFPWQHSGVQLKRTWPIAPTQAVLYERWRTLCSAPLRDRDQLMRSTPDRGSGRICNDLLNPSLALPPITTLNADAPPIAPLRYAYRSFDRQWVLPDSRVMDRPRPPLWGAHGPCQIYLASLLTKPVGGGAAASVSASVPDMDFFSGRGAKDVIPLYRDAQAIQANVTRGLLLTLSGVYGEEVTAEDLFAYVYAVLQCPSYTRRFARELRTPGPRVPVTRDGGLFRDGLAFGRRLIWLHTYGEQLVSEEQPRGRVPQGLARSVQPVPPEPELYPQGYAYDSQAQVLRVGEGTIEPVGPEVFGFTVSGFPVVRSWLDYRMATPRGRKSSPLDDIRPTTWSATFTAELLELLWVLEATVAMGYRLDEWLERVVAGPLVTTGDLPQPTEMERKPPATAGYGNLFEAE